MIAKLTFFQSIQHSWLKAIALLLPITLWLNLTACQTVNSMKKVSWVIAEQYGLKVEEVGVGFWEEAGTKDNLEIIVLSKRFPGLTDAQMQAEARKMAQIAYRNYDKRDGLKAIVVKFEAPARVYTFQRNELIT